MLRTMFNRGSGKGAALLPLPPLRTGRESFPSSGSSRHKAPLSRSRFTRRFQSSLTTMNAKPFEERTVFKVGTPTQVERIRVAPDFQMPPDAGLDWVDQSQPDRLPVRRPLSGINREQALTTDGMPVPLDNPSAALAWVPASGPSPETVPQSPFHFLERPLRHDMAMVVGPATNDWVELTDQVGLADSATLTNQLPHLVQESVRIFLGGLDKQLAAILAEILSEEVEPLFNMGDAGFLWRELQATVAHKLLDHWLNLIFQYFLGRAGDDEVVRISNEVYFQAGCPLDRELLFEQPFQSVQCQVSQRRRDDSLYTMDNNPCLAR